MDHRERHGHFDITYWKGHTAAERHTADRMVVEVAPDLRAEFKFPEEEPKAHNLIAMLDIVFHRGRLAKAAEIRKVLGVGADGTVSTRPHWPTRGGYQPSPGLGPGAPPTTGSGVKPR